MTRKAAPPRSAPTVKTIDGLDLGSLVPNYWAVLLSHQLAKPRTSALPECHFKSGKRTHGFANWVKHEITIFFSEKVDRAEAMEIILHELCHLAIPVDLTGISGRQERIQKMRQDAHGHSFKTLLVESAVRIWGKEVEVSIPSERRRCYVVDDLLTAALRRVLGLPWRRGSWLKDSPPPAAAPTPVAVPVATPRRMTSSELLVLPVGTKVAGYFGEKSFVYVRAPMGFVPLMDPSATPYSSTDFAGLCSGFATLPA